MTETEAYWSPPIFLLDYINDGDFPKADGWLWIRKLQIYVPNSWRTSWKRVPLHMIFFLRRCWIVRTPGQKEFLYFGWGSLEINRWNLASWLSVAFNGHFFNPCFVKKKLNRETKKFKRPETISEMSKSNEVIFSSTSLPSHKVATAFVDWTYVCKCNRTCLIIKTILSMKKL